MSGLLKRIGELFVAPEAGESARPVRRSAPQIVGVLSAPDDLAAAAGGIAAALRRAAGSRTAVVCRVGEPPVQHAASPAATTLARKLADRELNAAASGTLCHVGLAADAVEASRDLWHVAGAVEVPVVLVLAGRRDGFDGLLTQLDHLVLAAPAGADETLTELALASLAALGPVATRALSPTTLVARRAAALGLHAIPLDGTAEDILDTVEPEPFEPGYGPAGAPA